MLQHAQNQAHSPLPNLVKVEKTWYKAAIFTMYKGESVEFVDYQLL